MILICHWAHLQPLHWVDEGDRNDGQTEGQYNDGKETERCMASSEAPDIAIDVPALQSTRQRKKRKWVVLLCTEEQHITSQIDILL